MEAWAPPFHTVKVSFQGEVFQIRHSFNPKCVVSLERETYIQRLGSSQGQWELPLLVLEPLGLLKPKLNWEFFMPCTVFLPEFVEFMSYDVCISKVVYACLSTEKNSFKKQCFNFKINNIHYQKQYYLLVYARNKC